jgi:hypothetical protein
VLGEIGMDAGTTPAGVERQAEALDWQLATAVELGVAGTCIFSWTDEWAVGGNDVQGWRQPRHARAARRLAEAHLDARVALPPLLERVGLS